MPMQLSTAAKNRAADAIVQPIKTADGTLRLKAGTTVVVSFTPVRFSAAASNGVVTADAIAPKDATAAGVVNVWELLDNTAALIASGVAGQRYQITSLDRVNSKVNVTGDLTSVFAARSNVTLHNKNDTTQNVYVTVDNAGPTYDSVANVTTIPIFEDLNAPPYSTLNWTHIHVGEVGLDNNNINVDQRVTVDSFKITVR